MVLMSSSFDLGSECEDGQEVIFEFAVCCAKEDTCNFLIRTNVEKVTIMDNGLVKRPKKMVVGRPSTEGDSQRSKEP